MSWSPEKKREMRQFYRREVLKAYGGACSCCNSKYADSLCLDHKHGRQGGWRERDRDIYEKVYRADCPDTMQLLCWTCNWMKFQGDGTCHCKQHIKVRNYRTVKPNFI